MAPRILYRKCEMCGTRSARENNQKRKFIANFPLDAERCKIWVKRTGNEDLIYVPIEKLHELKYLCDNHFNSKDFNRKKTRLKKWAVPSQNLPAKPLPDDMLKEFPFQIMEHHDNKGTGVNKPLPADLNKPATSSAPVTHTNETTDVQPIPRLDVKNSIDKHTLKLNFGIPKGYEDDPPVLGQTGQIESSINVDTGEEEVLETEEIVYDDGYRCPSPEVVEKEIPKVLPVLCVKCSQLIETHLYVCASCSDSQYEPLCATCAEHAALDAHAACYVLRARVTRPKTEIRGVLCAIRSELAMKSFADDLEDAITDIKSETADIPEDTDVLDVDPFDEIDSAVAVSAEGDPNASLTTSDNEDTDDSSSDYEYTASVADRTVQDLLESEPELDVTTENEWHKSPHPTTCLPSPKTVNVVQRRDEPQLASTLKPLHTPIGINIMRNDAQPKLQAFPAPKGTLASVTVQSDDTKSAVTTGLKRLRDDIDSYAKAKKVKLNNPQKVRTKLITVKKCVSILRKDLQIEKLNTIKDPGIQILPRAVQNVKSPIMPKGVKEITSESTDLTCSDELTMEPEEFVKLSDQLRNCKVLLQDLKLPPNLKKLKLISKQSS